jgi:hypothetical protein
MPVNPPLRDETRRCSSVRAGFMWRAIRAIWPVTPPTALVADGGVQSAAQEIDGMRSWATSMTMPIRLSVMDVHHPQLASGFRRLEDG